MSLANIQKLGPYYLLKQIGEGGMGQVFVAYKQSSDGILTQFAIKTLPDKLHKIELVQHLKKEAKLISNLRHDLIASFYELGREDDKYYMVLEYVEGLTLKKLINDISKGQTWNLGLAIHIACEILEGLEYLHRFQDPETGEPREVIHGDLTPGNILLNFEGGIKLIDFGLSSFQENPKNTEFRNPHYASPKRYLEGKVLPTDDIFGFGIILWELVTQVRYYAGENSDIGASLKNFAAKDPRSVNPAVPSDVAELILRCLNTESMFGYHSVSELSGDLRQIKIQYNYTRSDLRKFLMTTYEEEARGYRQMRKAHSETLSEYLRGNKSLDNTEETMVISYPDQTVAPDQPPKGLKPENHFQFPGQQNLKPKLVPLGPGTFAPPRQYPAAIPEAWIAKDHYLRAKTNSKISLFPSREELQAHIKTGVLFALLIISSLFLYVQRETAQVKLYTDLIWMIDSAQVVGARWKQSIDQERGFVLAKSRAEKSKRTIAAEAAAIVKEGVITNPSVAGTATVTVSSLPVKKGTPAPDTQTKMAGPSVYVTSTPIGAQIFINGEAVPCLTPCDVSVTTSGSIKVEVQKDGYPRNSVFTDKVSPYIDFDLTAGTFIIR